MCGRNLFRWPGPNKTSPLEVQQFERQSQGPRLDCQPPLPRSCLVNIALANYPASDPRLVESFRPQLVQRTPHMEIQTNRIEDHRETNEMKL